MLLFNMKIGRSIPLALYLSNAQLLIWGGHSNKNGNLNRDDKFEICDLKTLQLVSNEDKKKRALAN